MKEPMKCPKCGLVEEWRLSAVCRNWYEVSSIGRLRSVDRVITYESRAGNPVERFVEGKMVNPTVDQGLRKSWRPWTEEEKKAGKKGRGCSLNVIRIVYDAFVSPIKERVPIEHIDGDRTHDCYTNLKSY